MSSDAIVPFRIQAPEGALDDLRRRLRATRWPDRETVDDWSQGIPLAYVQEICRYWADEYDWPQRQELLNRFPQFKTEVDGLDLHFMHVRSPHEDALPLVITHGWPGSVAEFQDVIDHLTDPTSHGGDSADAFHVVCPSLPGFGFSGKPERAGWGLERIADAWSVLMVRLGYDRFLAQGGDWGSMVATTIGMRDPDHCMAIHLNMALALPDPETMDDLSDSEVAALAAMDRYQKDESGYSKQQSTRPQTLGYGLVDSPAGQAAWILEKFHGWTDNDGTPESAVPRDQLLDNVMLYWLPGTGASSARLYWESFSDPPLGAVQVPVGASVFPKELFRTSRRWAEKHFGELIHFRELEHGGHFAAMEQPDLFVTEVRDCFRSLR
jgi:epoxide hydrolase